MIFNLGLSRFKNFKKTIKAIENKDFASAADEMLNSAWANQVGQRAITLSNKMRG
jgi:lysozyme